MKTLSLDEFFCLTNYDWRKDEKQISHICNLTKTRIDPIIKQFVFSFGMEQPFVMKAIADYFRLSAFFEIGTGRGTASYSVALSSTIREVVTLDLLEPKQKRETAIGYQKVVVSNRGIYDKIECPEKVKVKLKVRKPFIKKEMANYPNRFDMCFVDGEHDNKIVIGQDIDLCRNVCKEDAVMVFDDYCQNKFGVKAVVDELLSKNGYNAVLVEMRGHLFDPPRKERNEGLVIVSKRGLL